MKPYDVVVCVAPHHQSIAIKSIRSLCCFSDTRQIFVIAPYAIHQRLRKGACAGKRLVVVDEDEVEQGLSKKAVEELLKYRNPEAANRAGWYFQQFLKMAACKLPNISSTYVIWDSDTLLLRRLDFLGPDGELFVNPQAECHQPYFDLMSRVLGLKKQVSFSFVAEHLVVDKSIMAMLLDRIRNSALKGCNWFTKIIQALDDDNLAGSGFSEYETYGNFHVLYAGSKFVCRPLRSIKEAAKTAGTNPTAYDIHLLMNAGYVYASFDNWERQPPTKLLIYNRLVNALMSLAVFVPKDQRNWRAARRICDRQPCVSIKGDRFLAT